MGLDVALGEITLVLFTTLAPSSALALAVMGLPIIAGRASAVECARISRFVWMPLTMAMMGFVASATHLGNPANALYVLSNVGKSPLSNEVVCAVAFLGSAGTYWLYSFAERPHATLQRGWMGFIGVTALAFVGSMSLAYDVETIAMWSSALVPWGLWLNACGGGVLLAILGWRLADFDAARGRVGAALIVVAGAAFAGNVVVCVLQGGLLAQVGNAMATGPELVPCYGTMLAAFAVLVAAAVAVDARAFIVRARKGGDLSVSHLAAASCLAFAGIFVMRFAFYMMHFTVGVNV